MDINLLFNTMNDTLSFAASELASYLYQIDPSITTYFNRSDCNSFEISLQVCENLSLYGLSPPKEPLFDDQYAIHITHEKGSILGTNPRSVLLGVYKLLYSMGCRFLQPGQKYEYIPKLDLNTSLLDAPIHICCSASLRHRGVCIEGANAIENILEFIDWLPKLGYNSFFMQFKLPYTFLERWYLHTLNPLLKEEFFSLSQVETFDQMITDALTTRNLLHHRVGHGWTCETLGLSDLGWHKNESFLAAEKQNWLALVDGERDFFRRIPTNTNLCYSNPDVQKAFVSTILEYIITHTEIDFLHIWLADEHNNLCECENCKDQLLSDQYISLLNQLDQELSQLNSSTKIVFLLYQELLWPPIQEYFANQDRFILMFAPISRTFEKSYREATIPKTIPPYIKNKIHLPNSLEDNLSFLKKWQEAFNGDSFIYDYPLGRAHYGDAGYLNISQILSQDIKSLNQLGLNGYISCQELRAFFPHSFPNYIMGLTLFDTSTDFDLTLDDYLKHIYTEHHLKAKNYLLSLSKLYSCDYFNAIGPRTNYALARRYELAQNVANEFSHAALSSKEDYFSKKLLFHTEYVKLLSSALYHLCLGNTKKAQEEFLVWGEFIQSNELAFQESLDVYRVIEVATKYTGFTLPDYYQRK